MKRFLLLLLAVMMIAGFAAAEGKVHEVSTVAQLQEALANAQDGDTVRLMKDLTIGKDETLGARDQMYVYNDITLDMNGKTLRDERTRKVERVINLQPSGSMSIIGHGRFENANHDNDFLQALGPLFIYSGHFAHDPFTWGDPDCIYKNSEPAHIGNYRKLGYMISSYINGPKGQGYQGYVTVYGGTFDSGVKNPEAVWEAHGMSANRNKTCYYMYPIINEGNQYAHGVTTYGGTYVTASPANGEANWMDGVSIKDPYYLNGQTELFVAPAPYTLTESKGSDNRMRYTLDYPVTLTVLKTLTNRTDAPTPALSGFRFELKNTATGKTYSAVSDADGKAVFDLPLENAEDLYTLREIPGDNPQMLYSDLVYDVKIVPGPREERYKPVAQLSLNGEVVDSAVFETVLMTVPATGDTQNAPLYAALLLGSMLALILISRKRVHG